MLIGYSWQLLSLLELDHMLVGGAAPPVRGVTGAAFSGTRKLQLPVTSSELICVAKKHHPQSSVRTVCFNMLFVSRAGR